MIAGINVARHDGTSEEAHEEAEVRVKYSQISANNCNGMVVVVDV